MFDLSWLTQAYKREYAQSDEKVVTLAEAIKQHLEPGQIIQIESLFFPSVAYS